MPDLRSETTPNLAHDASGGNALPQQAEHAVAAGWVEDVAAPAPEMARLLHEVQAQKIELEMQNAELRRAHTALDAARARYFDVYHLAPVGYVIVNEEDVILEANLAAATLMGTTWQTMIGQRLAQFVQAEDQNVYNLYCQQSDQTQAVRGCEVRLLRADGAVCWARVDMTLAPGEEGAAAERRVVLSDITAAQQVKLALQASEEKLRSVIAQATDGVVLVDWAGNVVEWNAAQASITGVSRADALGRPIWEMQFAVGLPEEQREDVYAAVRASERQALATQDAPWFYQKVERAIQHPDGSQRIVESISYPIHTEQGFMIGSLTRDITERKQAENALLQSQQNLARAQQVGHLGNWEWDLTNQTLVWSDELYRIFGVERGFPLQYDTIEGFIHPNDRALNNAKVQEALASADALDLEFRITRPDGAVRYIYQSIEITRDATGVARKLFGIMQDITERKAATAALQRSEANLHALIENTDDLIASRDTAGGLIAFNSSFARLIQRLFGVEAQPGLRTMDFLPYAQRKHWGEVLAKVHKGARHEEEFTWNFDDDARRYELSFHPIWAGNEVIGSTEFTRDITERKHLQAQLAQARKMETIGRLAGGIAHDFNNMLAVIMIRTEMALQMATPATPLHRNLTEVYATAQRSAELVRNLLGFARKQVTAPRALDLNAAIEQTLPVLRQVIGEEIELLWRPGAALWPVNLDPAQIDQMLANLCVNARDVIGGIGTITVETANVTLAGAVTVNGDAIPPGAYVLLAVSDTGGGMEPESFANLFEPFFRTTTVGTGLGLATVDGIVQQNHGHIQVINEPGIGKTLKILFPRHSAGAVDIQGSVRPQVLVQGHGETLLFVEDEVTVLNMASEALQNLGYVVIATTTAEGAVHAVESHQGAIDLLITDIVMPKMNGRELADRIAMLQPGIKCLYVSGYPVESIANHGVLEPGRHFLQKPFTFSALASKVREALG